MRGSCVQQTNVAKDPAQAALGRDEGDGGTEEHARQPGLVAALQAVAVPFTPPPLQYMMEPGNPCHRPPTQTPCFPPALTLLPPLAHRLFAAQVAC